MYVNLFIYVFNSCFKLKATKYYKNTLNSLLNTKLQSKLKIILYRNSIYTKCQELMVLNCIR